LLYIIIAIGIVAFMAALTIILVCLYKRFRNQKVTPELIQEELKKLKDTENQVATLKGHKEDDHMDTEKPRERNEDALMMDDYYNRTLNKETPK
jgi:hypothetical protein